MCVANLDDVVTTSRDCRGDPCGERIFPQSGNCDAISHHARDAHCQERFLTLDRISFCVMLTWAFGCTVPHVAFLNLGDGFMRDG